MMAKLKAAWAALQAGRSLADVATWKVRQNAINAVGGAVVAAVALLQAFGISIPLPEDQLADLAAGLGAVVWVCVNLYLTTATTDKIGLSAKPDVPQPPSVPGEGHDLLGI